MIVEMAGCFKAAHGTFCKNRNGSRVIITTRKAATTNPHKMRMYLRTAGSYQRRTPVSDAEIAAQALFTRRTACVRELMASGACKTRAEAWKIAKREIK